MDHETKVLLEIKKVELEYLIKERSDNISPCTLYYDDDFAVKIVEKIQAKIDEIKALDPSYNKYG